MSEPKSGGLINFLKSAFVEDVPDDARSAAKARESQAPAPLPGAATPAPAAPADPAAMAKLETLLQASLPPIYAAWMEKFTQLAEVIPDDAMRFKAALKTSGATPAQLSAAVDQILGALDKAHEDFLVGFQGKTAKIEGAARDAISSTEALIASRESQLKAIQEEVASLRSKLATETTHLRDEQLRLDGVRQGFESAHAQVVGRLNAQKTHIASMSKG